MKRYALLLYILFLAAAVRAATPRPQPLYSVNGKETSEIRSIPPEDIENVEMLPADEETIARYGQPRGNILVGGVPVTGSRDTREQLRYERTYLDGALYAPVTGFASQTYGTTTGEEGRTPPSSGTPSGSGSPWDSPASP